MSGSLAHYSRIKRFNELWEYLVDKCIILPSILYEYETKGEREIWGVCGGYRILNNEKYRNFQASSSPNVIKERKAEIHDCEIYWVLKYMKVHS
jgi:hypothetical protein